jgi:hypothetical protein
VELLLLFVDVVVAVVVSMTGAGGGGVLLFPPPVLPQLVVLAREGGRDVAARVELASDESADGASRSGRRQRTTESRTRTASSSQWVQQMTTPPV